MQEYVLDGARITSLEAFYDEVSRVLTPETAWGRNLDAFDDALGGGFRTNKKGFVIRWVNADGSRGHLGYAETVRVLERRLEHCHPSNADSIGRELDHARTAKGRTVFAQLVEVIARRGPDGIDLVLE